jgi:hypothetical protein
MVTIAGTEKAAGVRKLFKPSAHSFLAAFILGIAPPLSLAAPPLATLLLAVGVVLPPLGSTQRQQAGRRVASAIP